MESLDDQLIDAARVPTAVKAAAGATGLAAALGVILALQNLTLVQWAGAWMAMPIGVLLLGGATAWAAMRTARGRPYGLSLALSLSIALVTGCIAWLVIAFMSGVVSLLGLTVPAVGLAAILLDGLALVPYGKLTAARRQLKASGHDLDL